MKRPTIEIHQVSPVHQEALIRFFGVLQSREVDRYFHPHPFTVEAARERAAYNGEDLYVALLEEGEILGYGMLRGWDEGYDIPSLGIVIHPDAQGLGLGRLLMDFLRAAALRRGANTIRLRVYPGNQSAVKLYRSLGYELTPENYGPYLVGTLDLVRN